MREASITQSMIEIAKGVAIYIKVGSPYLAADSSANFFNTNLGSPAKGPATPSK